MNRAAEFLYYAKKWYALYPGVFRLVSGGFLAEHYARRHQSRGLIRKAADAVVGLGFRGWIPIRARAVQKKYGLSDEWRRSAAHIAKQRFADPNDIALFRIEKAEELDGYIRRFEDAALNKIINPLGWSHDCALVNKVRFYERCAANGLPHPEVVALVQNGEVKLLNPARGRPLLIKPARGEGGRGVSFLDEQLSSAEPIELLARLKQLLLKRSGVWIVQPKISPHPDLGDLALNALPTIRITTIFNEDGVPEPANAVLRFPSDPVAEVDNMKAGGILSSVDVQTGTLGLACKGYGGGDFETHPVTRSKIPGRRIPMWEEAKALAVRAHQQAFSEYALVGWDVAISPDGPILFEGNSKPGVLMPQRSGSCPSRGRSTRAASMHHIASVIWR